MFQSSVGKRAANYKLRTSLVATAILGLAHAVPDWLAALIVAVVLLAAAGVAALVGKKNVEAATPPQPERAIEGIQEDVATVKGQHR